MVTLYVECSGKHHKEARYDFQGENKVNSKFDWIRLEFGGDPLVSTLILHLGKDLEMAEKLVNFRFAFPEFIDFLQLIPRKSQENIPVVPADSFKYDEEDLSSRSGVEILKILQSMNQTDGLVISGDIGDVRIRQNPVEEGLCIVSLVFWINEELPELFSKVFRYFSQEYAIPEVLEQVRASTQDEINYLIELYEIKEPS